MDESVAKRFLKNVPSWGGDPDACWPWAGSVNRDGYGQFNTGETTVKAQRFAWILAFGPIENPRIDGSYHGICVRRKCADRLCCNPHHLFLGVHNPNIFRLYERGQNHGIR